MLSKAIKTPYNKHGGYVYNLQACYFFFFIAVLRSL